MKISPLLHNLSIRGKKKHIYSPYSTLTSLVFFFMEEKLVKEKQPHDSSIRCSFVHHKFQLTNDWILQNVHFIRKSTLRYKTNHPKDISSIYRHS
jgi:hypothetical protein